jgi:hypothetical protein
MSRLKTACHKLLRVDVIKRLRNRKLHAHGARVRVRVRRHSEKCDQIQFTAQAVCVEY